MDKILINPGPLTSFNSLSYHLGPHLNKIRNQYIHGNSFEIELNLTELNFNDKINVSALAALLSTLKVLADFQGKPLETYFPWDPYVQGFLHNVDFFNIATKLNILSWSKEAVGGFSNYKLNPNTTLLYFGDNIPRHLNLSIEELEEQKFIKKRKIGPNFIVRAKGLMDNSGLDDLFIDLITNITLEFITNSLVHGRDYCFVALQRFSKRITISVCDSGIGFKRSLQNAYPEYSALKNINHTQAIILGCLIQKKYHGLRMAIDQVLNLDEYNISYYNEGWVIVSSYDTEIRWQKKNWENAKEIFEHIDLKQSMFSEKVILGEELKDRMPYDSIQNMGYYKKYPHKHTGTRVTFEIKLEK